jgi:hypothetical protein
VLAKKSSFSSLFQYALAKESLFVKDSFLEETGRACNEDLIFPNKLLDDEKDETRGIEDNDDCTLDMKLLEDGIEETAASDTKGVVDKPANGLGVVIVCEVDAGAAARTDKFLLAPTPTALPPTPPITGPTLSSALPAGLSTVPGCVNEVVV